MRGATLTTRMHGWETGTPVILTFYSNNRVAAGFFLDLVEDGVFSATREVRDILFDFWWGEGDAPGAVRVQYKAFPKKPSQLESISSMAKGLKSCRPVKN